MLKKILGSLLLAPLLYSTAMAQSYQIIARIDDEAAVPIEGAVVELMVKDKAIQSVISKKNGEAVLSNVTAGTYDILVSFTGYTPNRMSGVVVVDKDLQLDIQLKSTASELTQVVVRSSKPFIQREQGKLIVNPDASPTNTGTTVAELLERSPGVIVDRNNGISLRNKSGVLVLIDDKPTYLQGAELMNLLASMNTSQVDKLELITNPSAKYDAAGNSGIINIKTKKNKQVGFNGTYTSTFSVGKYPRANQSLILNYRKNKFNHYLSYGYNYAKQRTTIYALRTYKDATGATASILDQPTKFTNTNNNHALRYGVDFSATEKLTLNLSLSGNFINRKSRNTATANWMSPQHQVDSSISTFSRSQADFSTYTGGLGLKYQLNKDKQISVDVDAARYNLQNSMYFQSDRTDNLGYTEATSGEIPSIIKIWSAQANYTASWGKDGKMEAGVKTSRIDTDNEAIYARNRNNGAWTPDYGRSNHFLYSEQIQAAFTQFEQKFRKLTLQGGLRYEYTHYNAHQLGNSVVKDSSFSRFYDGIFPSAFLTYEADSINTFAISVGRRIDRPSFQKLNPFVNIINKYTTERGNPFFRPQFTWNFEVSHQYKQLLHTTVSYSLIRDYFSQLFLTDPDGSLVYTQGNVGRMHNITFSTMLTTKPTPWWNLNTEAIYTHKKLIGYVWNNYRSDISQFTLNMNNTFRISNKLTGEITGSYTGRSRNDLQELLYPFGQVAVGFSMPVLKNAGTLRFSARDIFWTFWMEGVTDFMNAEEYFIVRRDSRVFSLAFSYRFGKAGKASRQKAATDEMRRVEL